ncbi:MAG TPA: CoA pyrophosphatase [Gemmatimonadales bacterium]|nr:CoA pyrophosphatase [Gemmatimonadales bacterium]
MLRRVLPLAQPLSLTLSPSLAALAERLARRPAIEASAPERRWAAVALILAPDPDSILLIRRAERAGDPWSGQIGLPGGRRGPEDADLVETATREAVEEVGIALSRTHRLGVLDDVTPRTPTLPPIAVRPYVFALPTRPPVRLNAEVASSHWIALADLAQPAASGLTTVTVRGSLLEVPAFLLEGMVVWGMTERILASFLQAIS